MNLFSMRKTCLTLFRTLSSTRKENRSKRAFKGLSLPLLGSSVCISLVFWGPGSRAAGNQSILSAYFGLNNEVTIASGQGCPTAILNQDGLPVVMSSEVIQSTLQAGDFRVHRADSTTAIPICATLVPSNEEDEDRTVLLIGEFGDSNQNPVSVELIGTLGREGTPSAFPTETFSPVTVLSAGPSLVCAETVTGTDAEIGQTNDCPSGTTSQVVRLYWNGGVTADSSGNEFTDNQLSSFMLYDSNGNAIPGNPTHFGDLNDQDNVLDLCVGTTTTVGRVHVSANTAYDPDGDPNLETEIAVTGQ